MQAREWSSCVEGHSLRRAMRSFATGVAVITGRLSSESFVGLTVNSFGSVSLNPPLILWSIKANSPSFPAFSQGRLFVVNVLSVHQADLSRKFARTSSDKFSGVEFGLSRRGLPLLAGSCATFECETVQLVSGGDHVIVLARVLECGASEQVEPLIFVAGRYARVADAAAYPRIK